MKKLLITLFFGGFFILFSPPKAAKAGVAGAEAAAMIALATAEIVENIPYPTFAKDYNFAGEVDVLVHVEASGTLKVIRVLSSDVQVTEYVKSELVGKPISAPLGGQTLQIKVKYILL